MQQPKGIKVLLIFNFCIMIEVIGNNAGLVWNALSANNGMSIKALKKATKISKEKDLYAALGWLGREGKISMVETEDDVVVTLL